VRHWNGIVNNGAWVCALKVWDCTEKTSGACELLIHGVKVKITHMGGDVIMCVEYQCTHGIQKEGFWKDDVEFS
jgi:hypothetical protein